MAKPGELTPKQEFFCKEYIIDFNATRAAKVAGYSEKTAYKTGQENLKKPLVIEFLKKLKEEANKKAELTHDYVINGLKENHEKAQKAGAINASNRALELLGKHLNIFNEGKFELTGKNGGPIETKSTLQLDAATLKALAHGQNI